MRFKCPKCGSKMEIQKTFDGMMHVSCRCGIGDALKHSGSEDEVFLEFCARYDEGLVGEAPSTGVRDKKELKEMIRKNRPDKTTEEILNTKKDYVAEYRVLEHAEPDMGRTIKEMCLDDSLSEGLAELGMERFYKFQDEAIQEIISGNSVVIEAPTASGKTEAFLVPAIQRILDNPGDGVFAVFVYPTKALARDQHPKIRQLAQSAGVRVGVFDGDTGSVERNKIIENPPHIIITNFDVLHYHMLRKTRFSALLGTVRMVIVDEAHQYSGIFGSNVHYIIKRLRRLCGRLQFVAASATLDDPGRFCRQLFGEEMRVVRGSGRRGRTDFVMLFPSLQKQRALMIDLAKKMTDKKHKTMIFSNSHKNSELFAIQARRRKVDVMVHRAGLTARYREMVEKKFKQGGLMAISCTPTLELGIDIGDVDCVVSAIVPVNRLFQRIGRAARKGQRGYAFLALGNDPISQYYRNHPDDYFEDAESTYVDPKNPFIEEMQVLAMACDLDITHGELAEHREMVEKHVIHGRLVESGKKIVPNIKKIFSDLEKYNIRGIGSSMDIFLDGKKMGDRALPIALEELHKDAIYLLAGRRYKVVEMDYKIKKIAKLERIPPKYPYYTKALTEDTPTIKEEIERKTVGGIEVLFCKLHIEKSVYGYANIELGDDAGHGEKIMLDEPLRYDFDTKGIVFCAPRPLDAINRAEDAEYEEGVQTVINDAGCMMPEYVETSGYHAAEHVVIEGSNMIIGGASQDLGGISMGSSGMIYVYDGAVGGSGASKALYDRLEKVFERGRDIVGECPCTSTDGCPRCTYSYKCGNNNEFLHKLSALEIFERIRSGEKTVITGHEGSRPLV
ncbi:MAG: DEAD/DEAH box helicase [Nitrosopumilus sp. D6]|nr:MAG: DEAD/DEAH box helicase [Nitrosopumilus sp. D6]